MLATIIISNSFLLMKTNSSFKEDNANYRLNVRKVEKDGILPEGSKYKELGYYEGNFSLSNRNNLTLPSYVDLSTDPCFPSLGNQADLGSCVGFSTTYYQFSYEVNKMNGVTSAANRIVYSPKWTYNLINNGEDNGACISDAYIILKNYGALKISDLPYDNDYCWVPGNTNISSNEMISEKIEALETRVSSFGTCELPNSGTFIYGPNDSDLDVIKYLLNSGKILTISTNTAFNWKNGIDHNNTTIKVNYRCCYGGGHAMAIVGYDDNVWCDVNNNGIVENCEKGAFKIANSYGSTGVSNDTNGYKWVLYDALNPVSANTVNSWESYLTGTRTQALRGDMSTPTFWYINVAKYNINYIGEIEINTGNKKLSESQYLIGRAAIGSNVIYDSDVMLPETLGADKYNGKILFDYGYLCDPITSYLNGYNWYVNFTNGSANYNFKVVDNLEQVLANYGSMNNVLTKYLNINTALGDVNYSGNLTHDDTLLIQRYLLHLETFSNLQKIIADYNQDGIINMLDAICLP